MKKIVMLLVTFSLLLCMAACGKASHSGTLPESVSIDTTISTPTTEETFSTTEVTDAVSEKYPSGDWTTFGYTSEWLNMSFDAGGMFKAPAETIESIKNYNEARRKNDPNCSIIEMEFGWSNESNDGTPFLLTVEPISNDSRSLEEYAEEQELAVQDSFESYNLEYRVIETYQKYVTFLGEEHLERYTRSNSNGRSMVSYRFYRIKDNYLIQLSIQTHYVDMKLASFLSCFSTLDESDTSSDALPITDAAIPNYDINFLKSAVIYVSPDQNSPFIQVGVHDESYEYTYTITEAGRDSYGNLWGRLWCDFGFGWVLLEENSVPAEKLCSQCGQSEPEAIFTEDWKPGDICCSCSYDNFHGGEEGKKYCSECGSDCTYRGLEEDGRCEDCYLGTASATTQPPATQPPAAQEPTTCSHKYTDATCTAPKTCTICGATVGNTLQHTWQYTSCTTPKSCSVCATTLVGSTPGHVWENATCLLPETCSACGETRGNALGHSIELTKCIRCNYTNYSAIAKSYPNVTAYDSKTGEDLEVTNVSVSNSGVLSFTFSGKSYSITIIQRNYDSMTYFDCYENGSLLANASCRIGDSSYYNMLHFEWDGIGGHRLYFCAENQ